MNDLTAAVMRVQLGKIDGYLTNKIRNAQNIIEGLSDVAELTPQKVRPGDRHTYWNLSFTINTDRLGCNAYEFAEAVTAEGVPMLGPYIGTGREGPLYRNPVYTDALMFGASRYPLDYGRERPVDYRLVNCPYGEDLMGRGIQLSMNATFTENDLGDIIQGIRKVADYYRL